MKRWIRKRSRLILIAVPIVVFTLGIAEIFIRYWFLFAMDFSLLGFYVVFVYKYPSEA